MPTLTDDGAADRRSGAATLEPSLPPGGPNRVRALISVVLSVAIFLAGLASGAAVIHTPPQPTPPASWNDLLERIAKKMQAKYDLTETQQASLEQIVRTHQPKLDRIRARTMHEMRTELQQVVEETAAILTPEQASRFRAAVQPRLDRHFPPDGVPATPTPN